MGEIKLKPCPFCGGEARISKSGSLCIVMCADAKGDCPVKPWVGRYGSEADVIDDWNRRAEHE